MDRFDRAILRALQEDGSATNTALSEIVNLSASQCSRRRTALEEKGIIEGYGARINARALGFGLRAITRINLRSHGEEAAFAAFLNRHEEVRAAHSVSGDADYVLEIQVRDLDAFADFIHTKLLAHPQVAQVRSEIVLRTLKDERGLPLDL
ncbi:Lrp/AsnC family transcriptional regulator [Pararhizobium haloflavum]|uniref:Lrp/AsnC family transcriptional regulator n=1 Tax=Pararhizobium haloflavum TaxID=2037914 RepID=UPI000C1A6CF2|nr:Lrp/AsnC family transcriptional regulator [Pararhizobium haloflavum]